MSLRAPFPLPLSSCFVFKMGQREGIRTSLNPEMLFGIFRAHTLYTHRQMHGLLSVALSSRVYSVSLIQEAEEACIFPLVFLKLF